MVWPYDQEAGFACTRCFGGKCKRVREAKNNLADISGFVHLSDNKIPCQFHANSMLFHATFNRIPAAPVVPEKLADFLYTTVCNNRLVQKQLHKPCKPFHFAPRREVNFRNAGQATDSDPCNLGYISVRAGA